MNTVFALIAIIGGGIMSLVGYEVIRLDKFISPAKHSSGTKNTAS